MRSRKRAFCQIAEACGPIPSASNCEFNTPLSTLMPSRVILPPSPSLGPNAARR
jgi:hypothetical protein